MRLLWLSRHDPYDDQVNELKHIFDDDLEIVVSPNPVKTGAEVVQLMKRANCDEVCAVLPINLIEEIVELGVQPIRAQMHRITTSEGVNFIHDYFYRIKKIDIVREVL